MDMNLDFLAIVRLSALNERQQALPEPLPFCIYARLDKRLCESMQRYPTTGWGLCTRTPRHMAGLTPECRRRIFLGARLMPPC